MNLHRVCRNGFGWAAVLVVTCACATLPSHAITIPNGGTVVFTSPSDPSLGPSGETIIFQGSSTLVASNTGGFIIGRTLDLDTATATIIAKSSGQHQYDSGVTGSGTLIVTSDGFSPTYRFGGVNTWTGTLWAQGDISLRTFASDFFGDTGNTIIIDPAAGGAAQLNINNESGYVNPRNITLASGTAVFQIQTSAGLTNSGIISGTGVLRVSAFGDLALTGNNTYSGGTLLQSYSGKLTVGSASNLGTAGITLNGGTPTIKITGATPGAFPQTIDVYNNNLRIEVENSAATATWGGALGDYGHTTAVIYKTGPGRLNLTNNLVSYNYGGHMNFVVSNGVLGINYTNGSVGNVTVKSGGALGGTGKLVLGSGKSVTIENGGALAPGNSPGTLTISGPLVLNNTSLLDYELGPHDSGGFGYVGLGSNDLTDVLGDLTLDGILNVTALDGFGAFGVGASSTNVYRLFNYTGAFTDNGVTLGSLPSYAQAWIDTSVTGQVNLFVIPEPTAAVLMGMAALSFSLRRRANRGESSVRNVPS